MSNQSPLAYEIVGDSFPMMAIKPGSSSGLQDFLDVLERVVRDGAVALIESQITEYGAAREHDEESLIDTVGDCAMLPLLKASEVRELIISAGIKEVREFRRPQLVAEGEVLRWICSLTHNPGNNAREILDSTRVYLDYRQFTSLWSSPEWMGLPPERSAKKARYVGFQRGAIMAKLHKLGFVWWDAHPGNLEVYERSRVLAGDFDHATILYRSPPSDAQCATTLIPLLSSAHPLEYASIKAGYLSERGDGARVFDLIEFGDRTGWRRAFMDEDYDYASKLARLQVDEMEESDEGPNWYLLATLNTSLTQTGRHGESVALLERAAALAREAPESLAEFSRVRAYLTVDRFGNALETMSRLVAPGGTTASPSPP